MDLFSILTLIGGLALFLYGMNAMGDGLAKVSGGKLEKILENLTSSKWKAVLLGMCVTAVIQSSSATTVMVVGFVNSGIMKLSQTLSILMSDSAPKYCVKEGMEGEDVSQMQKQLVDMGYMRKTTGYYGDETKAAMKDFQSRNGLSADGLAGEKTYDMLYSPKAKESPKKAAQKKTKANISKMIEVARSKLGCKYILGNTGPKSFDCSGLVYYCLKQAGSNRRRLTAAGYSQVDDWEKISDINKLKKGDLICFYSDNFSKIGHIGIVISSSMMIDASSSNGKVVRREYKTTYWKKHFYCGRRPW